MSILAAVITCTALLVFVVYSARQFASIARILIETETTLIGTWQVLREDPQAAGQIAACERRRRKHRRVLPVASILGLEWMWKP